MNLRTIKKQIRGHLAKIGGDAQQHLRKEGLWLWMLHTQHGRRRPFLLDDPGRIFFFNNPWQDNPWAQRVADLEPAKESSRVLIVGTNAEVRTLRDNLPDEISRLCLQHGIRNARIEFASCLVSFWNRFYGVEHFFGRSATDVPALIITTGSMRNYSKFGGETINVPERLQQIAGRYLIPVVFIQPFHI